MEKKIIKLWYDREGDYLEVTFEQGEGYFKATANDQVMERVDPYGKILSRLSYERIIKFMGCRDYPGFYQSLYYSNENQG